MHTKSISKINTSSFQIRKCSVVLEKCDSVSNPAFLASYTNNSKQSCEKSIANFERRSDSETFSWKPVQTTISHVSLKSEQTKTARGADSNTEAMPLYSHRQMKYNYDDDTKATFERSKPPESAIHAAMRHGTRIVREKENSEESDLEITEVIPPDPLAPDRQFSTSANWKKKTGKIKSTKNTIIVNNPDQLIQIAKRKVVKKKNEPTLVIIDTNSISSVKGPVPVSRISLVSPISQPKVTGRSFLHAGHLGSSQKSMNHKTIPETKTSLFISQPFNTITNEMQLIEAASFVVPYLYSHPSNESLKKLIELVQKQTDVSINKLGQVSSKKNYSVDNDNKTIEQKNKNLVNDESNSILNSEIEACNSCTSFVNDCDLQHEADTINLASHSQRKEKLKCKKGCKKTDQNYFKSPLGNFFIEIGLNLVEEYVNRVIIKKSMDSLSCKHENISQCLNKSGFNVENNSEANNPLNFKLKKCFYCSFKTDSSLVLEHHLETPHEYHKMYKCNFCISVIESCSEIVNHMKTQHNMEVNLDTTPARYQCPNCRFEDSEKSRFTKHNVSCSKKHKPEQNQLPPSDWEPPAKIKRVNFNFSLYHNISKGFCRLLPKPSFNNLMDDNEILKEDPDLLTTDNQPSLKQRCQNPKKSSQISKVSHKPNISITVLPNPQNSVVGSVTLKNSHQSNKKCLFDKDTKLNICEICDVGFVNKEDLQTHLQSIHHAKFSKKQTCSTPLLRCQKCTLRFFTDQGLERHLLGAHGLVTMSIQEAARSHKDGGHCPICTKLFQWNLLEHMKKCHKIFLKPVNISYKCTVCHTAMFQKYQEFEEHVFAKHCIAKPKKKLGNIPRQSSKDVLKSLENNNEITILSSRKSKQCNSNNGITVITLEDQESNKFEDVSQQKISRFMATETKNKELVFEEKNDKLSIEKHAGDRHRRVKTTKESLVSRKPQKCVSENKIFGNANECNKDLEKSHLITEEKEYNPSKHDCFDQHLLPENCQDVTNDSTLKRKIENIRKENTAIDGICKKKCKDNETFVSLTEISKDEQKLQSLEYGNQEIMSQDLEITKLNDIESLR